MTDERGIDSVSARLHALDTSNRRLKQILGGTAFAAAAFCLMGLSPPEADTMTAKRFVLEDNEGRIRAILEMSDDHPRLAMLDSNGTERFELAASDEGPWMRLYDASGQERAYFGLDDEDGASLDMSDPNGTERVILGSTKGGDGLLVSDGAKVQRISLALTKADSYLFLRDEKHITQVGLLATDIGPILQFKGTTGKVQALLKVYRNEPGFGLYRSDGKTHFSRPRSRRFIEPGQPIKPEEGASVPERP